jgi:uroporphyrin-3 C-methyltransferase
MNDMIETPPVVPTPPAQAQPAWTARLGRALNLPLLLAVIAIAIALTAWLFSYRQAENLNQELAKRLSTFDSRSMESRTLASQAQETSRELLVKIGVLEQKLLESQSQQIALESLYQELARGRDEAVVAEIEQLLVSANNELQLSANVKAALIALQAADARLTRLDRPQLFPLRKAIGKDIERLRAAPFVDVPGITLKLDGLIDLANTLPLVPGKPATEKKVVEKNAPAKNWWQRFAIEAWADFTRLVQVQDMGKAEMPLLAPEQAYFARENVRLRLLSARLSLLAHDDKAFKTDLQTAQDWIHRYYDDKDRAVKLALQTLQQLSASQTRVDIPDIAGSLQAVRALKLAPERGGR